MLCYEQSVSLDNATYDAFARCEFIAACADRPWDPFNCSVVLLPV